LQNSSLGGPFSCIFPKAGRNRRLATLTRVKILLLFLLFVSTTSLRAATPALIFESGKGQVALIELFTSEGCSSCPPAETWLSGLRKDPQLWKEIVPVAFHVDYWDGLGWPDRFATPGYTQRQRTYAALWGNASVYTPGFVVNGVEWENGPHSGSFPKPQNPDAGNLRVVLAETIEVSYTPGRASNQPLDVEVAFLGQGIQSDVKRGENGGRKLTHDFTVLKLETMRLSSAKDGTSFQAVLKKEIPSQASAIAVWICDPKTGRILQATGGEIRD
jgi:hypothetical protein